MRWPAPLARRVDRLTAEEQAAADKKIAREAAPEANVIARSEAEAEIERSKAETEKKAAVAAVAAVTASTIATTNKTPQENKNPVKFKDAIGRKFCFPFNLCNTWQVGH